MHVPGWHEDTKALAADGALQVLGIIQEQHPDRCRLFMQWKQMSWPILVDSLNLTGIEVVPLTYAIDEHGIVRYVRPSREEFATFMATDYPAPTGAVPGPTVVAALGQLDIAAHASAADWTTYGDALFMWGGADRLNDAIDAYRRATELAPDVGATYFRLGTAHRRRYESEARHPDDFRLATEGWARALDINPNQYIWRRRIQQYGPRLDKPYPFYDWVDEARASIVARGDSPAPLIVEPAGAEIAQPADAFEVVGGDAPEPDPDGRIYRDPGRFITVESAAVPPIVAPDGVTRVHLVFRPVTEIKAHWNNEVDPLEVWIDEPPGWTLERHRLTAPSPPELVSSEARQVQLELKASPTLTSGSTTVRGYALYYVCEDVDGTCLYRRQDLAVDVVVER